MPFASMDEEEKKQAEQQGGSNISGTSTTFGVNVPGQTAGKGGPKSSGQYQNLQKYLAANEEQGTQMGQQVAQGVESKVGQAQQQGQALQSSVKAPGVYDPNKVIGNLGGASEEEKKTYQTMKQTGGYTGPSDITGIEAYNPYQKAKNEAQTSLEQAKTDVGQQALLGQTFARPQYSAGAKSLDQTLLARSQGGKQALEGLQNKYSGLLSELGGYESGATQAIQGSQAQAVQNKAAFAPAEQAAQQAIINPIQQRADIENQKASKYNEMLADLSDLELNNDTLNALGLQAGTRTYGTNLAQFLNPATMQANVENLATADERQKYNDLLNFLGTNTGQLSMNAPSYQGITSSGEAMKQQIAAREKEFKDAARAQQLIGDYGVTTDYGSALERDLGMPETESTRTTANYGSIEDMINSGLTPEEYLTRQQNKYSGNLINRQQMLDQINSLLNQFNYNDQIKVATNKDVATLNPGKNIGGAIQLPDGSFITGGIKGGF